MAPARKIAGKPPRGPKRVTRRPIKLKHKAAGRPSQASAEAAVERPRVYSKEVADTLLDRMANGETPTEVCRDPAMPSWVVMCRWRRQNEDFDKRYRIAHESCVEYLVSDVVNISDNAVNDYVDRINPRGKTTRVFDREHFERSRLRVESRKWMAAKILRWTYGDKSEVEVRTPDGVNIKVEARNQLINAIMKLVQPKVDGKTKPSGRTEEARER
jgi:hypothetical protein